MVWKDSDADAPSCSQNATVKQHRLGQHSQNPRTHRLDARPIPGLGQQDDELIATHAGHIAFPHRRRKAPEAVRVAIAIEDRNAETYRQLGDLFSQFFPGSPALASTFFDLSATERQHGVILSTRYRERFGTVHAGIAEEDIRDFIEVPR